MMHTPHLRKGSVESKRSEILDYFLDGYERYERLFDLLANDEAFYERPERLRHPLIFYFGHTATFFINKLMLAKLIPERVNPEFESMFAIGVDEMSWDDLNDEHYDWPSVASVREYRAEVKKVVIKLIQETQFSMPINWESPMWPILMGIEHEKIHLETSSVLIRQLDISKVIPRPEWSLCPDRGEAPSNELLAVSAGDVRVGTSHESDYYGWDNEYGEHRDSVKSFKASKFLVSNGEFLEFIQDGGYQNLDLWEKEGRSWLEFTKAEHPIFWKKEGDFYLYRALAEEIDLPLNWPVDVNYHEAKAFCHWKGEKLGKDIRLPTEDEWYRLRDFVGMDQDLYHEGMNINLSQYASSVPVDRFQHGEFYDVVGNVWQWSETPIYPLDGFKVHELYDDFTTPTYDNKHNLIKGGSWISMGNEAQRNARYAFRRHFFQHAGLRYVESDMKVLVNDLNYESDTQVSQYCEFHYGDQYYGVENFSKACAEFCLEKLGDRPHAKALDLGCAVGRATFELAKGFDHVDGIDFSARFIKTAYEMQEKGEIHYLRIEEGDLTSYHTRKLEKLGLAEVAHKANFVQGDACNLKPMFTDYDLVFMGNLVDRVPSPRKLLADIRERIHVGGLLIIASPFTWLEEYTAKEEWLGGYKDAQGETLTSSDALDIELKENFKRIGEPTDIPFVIRETKRKFQHTLSQVHVFERVK